MRDRFPSLIESAADLVVRGVNVLPIDGKVPRGPWKQWQDTSQIDMPDNGADGLLLLHFSRGGNLGAITGKVSGIVVVDVDSHDAWRYVRSICGGRIPETVTSTTSKGRHLWFRHPGGDRPNRARIGGEAIDLRADGGFVVVPPSVHPSGKPYRWVTSPTNLWPPAELPVELAAFLWPPVRHMTVTAPLVHARSSRYAETALANEAGDVRIAPVGGRNDRLNRAAFSLARLVMSGDLGARETADVLVSAATTAGLPEHEARRTVASAFTSRRTS